MYDIAHLDIPPLRRCAGTVRLPGSKSISNRVLLLAGLSDGVTAVHDLLESDDTQVMLAALERLGCRVQRDGNVHTVRGIGGRLSTAAAQPLSLFLGNAGTAMRPLAAALALLVTRDGGDITLAGVPRMHERPIGDLVDALRQLGAQVEYSGHEGFPPLRLRGRRGGVADTARPIRVRGDVSSQFLTALLLALPLASGSDGAQPIVVEVEGELISKPYVEITLALLQRFGIAVEREGFRRFTIPADSHYRAPARIHVEGDASSASYFIAAGAIAAVDAPLRIEGVGLDSIQGDIRFVAAARAMGAQVTGGPGWVEVRRGAWPLKAVTLDCNHMPDAAMTLAAMALFADGRTRLTHIGSWRVKETDRIAAMATELRRLGATVVDGADFIQVEPPRHWRRAALHTYDDHRMAMCLSLAAFNPLAGGGVPVRLLDPRCVAKTFPEYFETLFDVVATEPRDIPVITVDGPTASGKGTLASAVAARLGWRQLDSGALYRATALAAMRADVAATDTTALARLAGALPLRFDGDLVWLDGIDITAALRHEEVGALASRISALPEVRQALHALQLSFRRVPGLVADGRDMGTVVFADAALKVFLTASAAMRAERRLKQLISKGISAKLDALRADLEARDARDMHRAVAPLKPAQDALQLDNSSLTIEQSADRVLQWWGERNAFD
ncbi:MAG: bifunctional 3-phosphoshikimate 1-carboxyvinyltransferase/cytidylate kinase [Ideonella sp.]|nr:bifunctional 3-phosphoshikimate 1-carboxyvinyltransferase/cytidylate kinase [Ideonella sp.]MCC7457282.1 bifunctional 3-phosphoshikimate 1-carboxyvinyltransferase/cytidylate kinase [Nitrospira sp.]